MSWFSNYDTRHKFDPLVHGYNDLFREQVRMIRAYFSLEKSADTLGVDVGHGVWKTYQLQGNTYQIRAHKFDWIGITDYHSYLTPHFVLDTEIANAKGELLIRFPLVIEFKPEFPRKAPRLQVDTPKYKRKGISPNSDRSIEHHIFADGWLCIMNVYKEWDPKVDTIITAINRAYELVVWHVAHYGW